MPGTEYWVSSLCPTTWAITDTMYFGTEHALLLTQCILARNMRYYWHNVFWHGTCAITDTMYFGTEHGLFLTLTVLARSRILSLIGWNGAVTDPDSKSTRCKISDEMKWAVYDVHRWLLLFRQVFWILNSFPLKPYTRI
jgi:hypothetical protein